MLYRAEVVRARDPFFCERSLHEDTEACYEILRDWDFGFVHQVLSYWRTQPGSITRPRAPPSTRTRSTATSRA